MHGGCRTLEMMPVINVSATVSVPLLTVVTIRHVPDPPKSVVFPQPNVNDEPETSPEIVPVSLTTKSAIRVLVPVTCDPVWVNVQTVVWPVTPAGLSMIHVALRFTNGGEGEVGPHAVVTTRITRKPNSNRCGGTNALTPPMLSHQWTIPTTPTSAEGRAARRVSPARERSEGLVTAVNLEDLYTNHRFLLWNLPRRRPVLSLSEGRTQC